MTPTRILLAIDGRPTSAPAIRWTALRAAATEVTIEIVAVAGAADEDVLGEAVRAARAEILRSAPAARVATSVRHGDVFDILIELSADADLLVVGSDRPSRAATVLHTGLPMRLSGRVACTLVVVPSGWEATPGAAVAVGWDDGRAAEAAIEAAAGEAERRGLPLRIHHGWSPVPVAHYDAAAGEALTAAVADDERIVLDRVVRATSARYPALTVSGELHLGAGGAGLLAHAAEAELIVVGSHRRSMLGEILLGATGDELIAASRRIPVMIVRSATPADVDDRSRGGR